MHSDSSRHSDAHETGVVTKRSAGRGSVGLTERLAAAASSRSFADIARVLIDTGAGPQALRACCRRLRLARGGATEFLADLVAIRPLV